MRQTCLATLMGVCVLGLAVHAQDKENEGEYGKATLNGDIAAAVVTEYGKQAVEGTVSAYLRLDRKILEAGRVKVGGFNIRLRDVHQALVTGHNTDCKPFATWAFSLVAAQKEGQYLDYDRSAMLLKGTVQGSSSLPQFTELLIEQNEKENDFDFPTQLTSIEVTIQLKRPLESEDTQEVIVDVAAVKLETKVAENKLYGLKAFQLDYIELERPLVIEVVWWWRFEVAKKLCLQPVRIGTVTFTGGSFPFGLSVHYSGDGWAFGLPQLRAEWAKADVVFEERSWKTLFKSSYSTLTSGEASALRAEVDDDDCVEIFFVDQFSPVDQWGGGATWSGGTASTKIITTDGNADGGIDLTHLAHEVGHAITLKHPGSGFPTAASPHRVDGSSGTLMCGSGYLNDNPKVNSQWNKDNVQNPLFKFAIKLRSAGPDCQNNADCGPC
eukprot:TRINITY_DN32_c0_g1_i5.p1 TRINITY_DN32_c0_g1~~TRINITY_DN32_c0_g1_i5.p1  ORF type:complete len:440 (+),score=166.57 TRINITY_DN32_c0_g1_i5:67-1386(+)